MAMRSSRDATRPHIQRTKRRYHAGTTTATLKLSLPTDNRSDHRRMDRAMVRADSPEDHRSAERAGCDIARIKIAVVQHDAMRDGVHVVPHDHLAGRYRCRIR